MKRYESGQITSEDFYKEISQICGINLPYQS